jgi:hypothetical protein
LFFIYLKKTQASIWSEYYILNLGTPRHSA